MTTHNDILIGRIAVERALVSRDQLAECLEEQRLSPASPLGAIMLRRGYIKPRDLESLLDEQKQRLANALDLSDPKLEDALLGRLLIKQGLAREAQVYDCLREQAEIGETGEKPPRLGALLTRKGYLTTDAVDSALLLNKRDVFICPSCGERYSTTGGGPGHTYACKKCGVALDKREKFSPPGETTGAVKIEMPDDAAEAAKDPARRFADGKYILVREVGRGGTGFVWQAWQTDLQRYVAVKLLAGTVWTDVELKRFYREAQMAAGLSHTNIASVYEVGAHDGKHFIAMQFVDGESLAQMMHPVSKQGTSRTLKVFPARRAAEILREAALAVDYAHSKKIIHRDLKPHNIMVQKSDGLIFVMDFGLAKPVRSQEAITVSDAIVGTPSFMPPEQARGDAVDRRADVYSLGAVLYHVLTGRPPFEGRSAAEILMAVLADDPVPPRRLNPRLHADLETICLKALDKDRHRRYDSARSFADDLARYLDGEPILARPLSARETLWKAIQRRPALSTLVGAGIAATLLFTTILWTMSVQTQSKIDRFSRQASDAFVNRKFEESKTYWEKVLTLDPDHRLAQNRRDLCEKEIHAMAGQRVEEIRKAREQADSHFQNSKYDKAILWYERILALDAGSELASDRKKLCLEEIERARNRAEESDDARKKLEQREEQRLKKRMGAQPFYEIARGADRTAASMRLQAGFTITDIMNRYREAREWLTKAVREDAGYTEAWVFRGQVRYKMADYGLAEQDFREALSTNADSAAAHFNLAMTYLALFMIHKHTPFAADAAARGDALEKMLRAAEAASTSQNTYERWCARAVAQFHQRQYAAAGETLEKVAQEGRAQYFHHFVLSCIQADSDQPGEALQELTEALELEPAAFESLFLRAAVRAERADFAGALQDASKAVEAAPESYQGFLLRARIHEGMDENARMAEDLQRAAALAGPRAVEIRKKLASLPSEK